MATVKNFTNFTGKINGLVYYTVNGRQFVRIDKKTLSHTKANAEKMLPGIEAIHTMKALKSIKHVLNALKNEFETLKTPVCRERKSTRAEFPAENATTPTLEHVVRKNNEIKFTVRGAQAGQYIIILQINFETGDFRRKTIALEDAHCITKNTYTVETEYETRKGYTDLIFLYGKYFLKAVPILIKKDSNS